MSSEFAGFPIGPVRERPHYVKMMIYGKPGAGKTYLAAQAAFVPEMSPIMYLVPDAAELDTLRKAAPDAQAMQIDTWPQMEKIWTEATRMCRDPRSGGFPYKTVVVDTGTEAQKLSMRDIMDDLVKNGRPGGGPVDPDVPSQREWGQSISQMRRLIRSFRDLPINFIFVCHEQESRDNRGITWITPDLPGKLRNQTAGMFSNVFYLYVKQDIEVEGKRKVVASETRCLLTGLTEGFMAKSRTGAFPRVIANPKMADIYDAIVKTDMQADTETETEKETV